MTTPDYYLEQALMTTPGDGEPLLAGLPRGPEAVASVAQGLVVHEFLTEIYGFVLSPERRATVHVRPVSGLLARITAEDRRPLDVAREPARRLAGNCRHFTVLAVTLLRAQGTPARARCGFGNYFGSDAFEDHWVCEYWDSSAQRWVLIDAQLDDVQRKPPGIDFDVMDVPRDRFLVAGDAWQRVRRGEADPAKFGLSPINRAGDWWIAGNLLRDVAALNNMEMLPWDVWGAMPAPDAPIGDEYLELFDQLAALTLDLDRSCGELATRYAGDDRLRVPGTVFNAVLNRPEPVP